MSKKEMVLSKNLEKIIEKCFELGWESLILTDPNLSPQGIICGPKSFIEEFKAFTEDMANIEKDIGEFLDNAEIVYSNEKDDFSSVVDELETKKKKNNVH